MKKSAKVITVVICSLIIVLACYCCVVSFMDYEVYAQREKSHNKAEEYLDSDEYIFDRTMQGVRFSQVFYSVLAILCSISLITLVILWERLHKIADNPNYYTKRLISKKMLKIQLPLEIVSIVLLVILYLILQFVTVSWSASVLFMFFCSFFALPACMFAVNLEAASKGKYATAPMLSNQDKPKM